MQTNKHNKSEVNFTSLFTMYFIGVLITPASILLTIPIAFLYKDSLLYKFVLFVSVKQGDLSLILAKC